MSRGRVRSIRSSRHASAITPTAFRVGNTKRTVGDVRALVGICAGIVKPAARTVASNAQRTVDGTVDTSLAVKSLAESTMESGTISTTAESLTRGASHVHGVKATTNGVVIASAERPRSAHLFPRGSRNIAFEASSVTTSAPTTTRLGVTGFAVGVP